MTRSASSTWSRSLRATRRSRKGTNGVSTNGVTANLMFFDRGTFWVLPLTYFHLPKSARAYLFPQSVKIHYFCSRPISVDPTCPRPKALIPHTIIFLKYIFMLSLSFVWLNNINIKVVICVFTYFEKAIYLSATKLLWLLLSYHTHFTGM